MRQRLHRLVSFILLACLLGGVVPVTPLRAQGTHPTSAPPVPPPLPYTPSRPLPPPTFKPPLDLPSRTNNPVASLPHGFIARSRATTPHVRFDALIGAGTIQLNDTGYQLQIPTVKRRTVEPDVPDHASSNSIYGEPQSITVSFVKSTTNPTLITDQTLPIRAHEYNPTTQRWMESVRQYATITYTNLYPNIAVGYTLDKQASVKSTYVVAPQADPSLIQWQYQGVQDVAIAPNGDLVLTLPPRQGFPQRTLTETAPLAWQDIQGVRHFIPVQFTIIQNKRVAFTVGNYNAAFPLIIDPSLTITYAWTNPTDSEKIVPHPDGTWFLLRLIAGQSILTHLDVNLQPIRDIWTYPLPDPSQADSNHLLITPQGTLIWVVYNASSRSMAILVGSQTGFSTPQVLGQDAFLSGLVAHPFLDQVTLAWFTESPTTGDTTSQNLTIITPNGVGSTQQLDLAQGIHTSRLAYANDGTLYGLGTTNHISYVTHGIYKLVGNTWQILQGRAGNIGAGSTYFHDFIVDSKGRIIAVGGYVLSSLWPTVVQLRALIVSSDGTVLVERSLTNEQVSGTQDNTTRENSLILLPDDTVVIGGYVRSNGFPNPLARIDQQSLFTMAIDPATGAILDTLVYDDGGNTTLTHFATDASGNIAVVGAGSRDFVAWINDLHPFIQSRDSNDSPEYCPCADSQYHTEKPINTRTGNFWTDGATLTVAGRDTDPPLAWSARYTSHTTMLTATLPGFAPGWSHPYGTHLTLPTMPRGEPTTAIIESPKGNRQRFRMQATPNGTTFTPYPGVYSTLVLSGTDYVQTFPSQEQFIFSAQGLLTAQRMATGRMVYLDYAQGKVITIRDGSNAQRFLALTYTAAGLIDTVRDPFNRSIQYTYVNGDIRTIRDVTGRITTYDYQNHVMTGITNALNQPLERMGYDTYGPTGKVITQTLLDGRHLALRYTAASTTLTTTFRDLQQDVEVLYYDAGNTLTGHQRNGVMLQQSDYQNAMFAPEATTDANGYMTTATFNPRGQLTSTTNALGEQTRVAYDGQSRPISVTDSLRRTSLFTYDAHNNITRQTLGITTSTPLGLTTIYTYSATIPDRLMAEQAPEGLIHQYAYDAQGHRTLDRTLMGGVLMHTAIMTYTMTGLVDRHSSQYANEAARITSYGYDQRSRLITTTMELGTPMQRMDVTRYNADDTVSMTIQNYRGTGSYSGSRPQENITTRYGYDGLGRRIWQHQPDGRVDVWHYNAYGELDWSVINLTPVSWVNGQVVVPATPPAYTNANRDQNIARFFSYDGRGRMTQQRDVISADLMRVQTTTYTEQPTTITTQTDYQYNGQPGTPTQHQQIYDAADNLVMQSDALNRWTCYEYDALNRLTKQIQNCENRDPLTIDENNTGWATLAETDLVTVYGYYADGQRAYQTENYVDGVYSPSNPDEDRTTRYTYTPLGQPTLTTQNDAPGQTTTDTNITTETRYDAYQRPSASRDALGRWVNQHYDAFGRVDVTTLNCRDGNGNPVATGCVSYAGNRTDRNVRTTYGYDAAGRRVTTTDQAGRVDRTRYTLYGQTSAQIQNAVLTAPTTAVTNVTTLTAYDLFGRTIATTDALGFVTRYQYDVLGRVASKIDATATYTYTYNALGDRISVADSRHGTTSFSYDTQHHVLNEVSSRGIQTSYSYGYGGSGILSVTKVQNPTGDYYYPNPDQRLATYTEYDNGGRVLRTITYDAYIRTTSTDKARYTIYEYDLLDRVVKVIENPSVSFDEYPTCDHWYNYVQDADCNLITQYAYDRMGNRTSITDAKGNQRMFGYDAMGRKIRETDALGHIRRWEYDKLGRITWVRDPRGSSYDVEYRYDERDRMTDTLSTQLSAPIQAQYDVRNTRTSLTDASGVTTFTPNPLGRISRVTSSHGSVGYDYDALGRRTHMTYGGSTINYTYTPRGQLDVVREGQSLVADYNYDAWDRLASLTRANGAVTSYGYDAVDRLTRMETWTNGQPTHRIQYTLNHLGQRVAMDESLAGAASSGTPTPTSVPPTPTATSVPPTATTTATPTTPPASGMVLFVTGTLPTALNPSDTSIKGMLESRGYTVVAKKDTDAQTTDATGKVLILISSTVTSGNVNIKFRDTSVPVIVWEMALFDDMRMTLNQNSDQGTTENVTTGTVVNASHPMAAGLSGAVTLTTSGQALTYGEPNANGVVIVRAGGSNRSVLFGYDSCAVLKDNVTQAPARRVGVFLNDTTAAVLAPNGTALVNAAITWALGSRPCINGATATPTVGGATATPTSLPPTATATSVPPTATNVPPTATSTSIPPTATSTPMADTLVIRINAGSFADATYSGVLWKTDQYFSGGNTGNASTLTIAGTADQVLYQKTRTASSDLGSFSYAIPVPSAATYRVRLHFAETYWGATGGGAGGTGKRVFSVNLEGGTTELQNYDINAAVGPMTAVVKEYTIGVSDGTLNLDFSATVNRPIISAIEVFKVGGSGSRAPLSKGMMRPLMQSGNITYTTTIHTDYTYDHVGRLLTEQVLGQPATLYGYDRVGNRTSVSTNGLTSTLQYDAANQVVGWQYDAAGNLLNDGTRSYAYDALGRMTTLGTTTNQYNGDGVLVRQSVGATQTTFVNDLLAGLSQPLVIQRGTSFDRTVYGLERLTSTNQANTRTWYLTDGVGSVQTTLDDTGNVLTNPQYDAWGNVTSSTIPAPFGFTGEYRDASSGFSYLRARWYNPATGTLLGRDPFAGYAESPYSLHPFQYAYADPVSNTDPSGRDPWWTDPYSFECQNSSSPAYKQYCRDRKFYEQGHYARLANVPYDDMFPTRLSWTLSEVCMIGGLTPGVDTLVDVSEALTGHECGVGEQLSGWEQTLAGACILLPWVSGKWFKGIKHLDGDIPVKVARSRRVIIEEAHRLGHSDELQNAITSAIRQFEKEENIKDVYIAFRSRPVGVEKYERMADFSAKPPSFSGVKQIDPDGVDRGWRISDDGKNYFSDLDTAWVIGDGIHLDERILTDEGGLGDMINKNYGVNVVMHGDHMTGIGKPNLYDKLNIPEYMRGDVVIYSRNGVIATAPLAESFNHIKR